MENTKEIEKAKAHITVEIIEYLSNAVVKKTILKNLPEISVLCPLTVVKG